MRSTCSTTAPLGIGMRRRAAASLQVLQDCPGGLAVRRRRPPGHACAARRPAHGRRPILSPPPPFPGRIRGAASAPPTGTSPAGWRRPARRCPAPSRAPARTPRGRRRLPSDALGSIPIEPVSIAASSERMSPNMFSVTITSKWRGAATSCIAALSTSSARARCSGTRAACSSRTTSRHSRLVSSTLALSTLVTRAVAPRRTRPGRSARSPRACRRSRPTPSPRCASSRRSRSRRSARARPAGRCPRSISRRSGLASYSAGSGLTGRRLANSPRPLRSPSRPCSGRGLDGSVVSHFGPPTAASRTASAARQAASVSSVSAVPCASIDAPPNRCSSYSKPAPTASSTSTRRAMISGPIPSPGRRMTVVGHGRRQDAS